MAKQPWRNPFAPTGYEVDWQKLCAQPVAVGTSKADAHLTTAGEVLDRLLPDGLTNPNAAKRIKVTSPDAGLGKTLSTPETTIQLETVFSGTSFGAEVFCTVLDLLSEGVGRPIFFFYDEDHVTDDLHFQYSFFVADGNRIVRDRVSFHATADNGFTSEIFTDGFRSDQPIWAADRAILRAQVRWWYRKFYDETEAGRLTTLRDDVELYHFVPSWKVEGELLQEAKRIAVELKTMRWFLGGCLIALVVLALHAF